MTDLEDRVRDLIRSEGLLQRGDHVLAGVSGGADSVALLRVVMRQREALGIRLSVVHVDHQLRPDSAQDARFVSQLAGSWGIPVIIATRRVDLRGLHHGLSPEDAARRIRYDAFLEVATQLQANRLALAHTADDQAETVLLRLLRGAGPTGLAAIPVARPLDEVGIVRPFLQVSRRQVLDYLAQQGVGFRQDPTNADPRFVRNRIRAELLPLLERDYNPQIRAQLCQLADQCRAETDVLRQTAQRYWKRLAQRRGGEIAMRLHGFLRQPRAVQQHLFRLGIEQLQGDLAGFEFRHWLEIEALIAGRPAGSVVDLPGGIQCRLELEALVFRCSTT